MVHAKPSAVTPLLTTSESRRTFRNEVWSALARENWRCLWPVAAAAIAIHFITATLLLTNELPVSYWPAGLADMVLLFLMAAIVTPGYILAPQIVSDMVRQWRGLRPEPFRVRLTHAAVLATCGSVLAMLFACTLLINANLKPAIPVLNTSLYDVQLESIERTLFLGILPSEWLISRCSGAAIVFWDFVYDLFGTFLFVSMMIAIHRRGLRGGARLVLALSIGLFACLLIALAYPTRGPIFVHPEWFAALDGTETGRLARYLDMTVRRYVAEPSVRFAVAGIAAMPSYHVLSWTCGWLCWRGLPRWLFAFGGVLVGLNWISTVVLGWHYALDGAVAVVLALFVWWLAGRILSAKPFRSPRGERAPSDETARPSGRPATADPMR